MATIQETAVIKARMDRIPSALSPELVERIATDRASGYVNPYRCNDTIYTSCCNATRGIYYYTTYDNHQITAVDMYREDLDGAKLVHYPLCKSENIYTQN